MQLEKCHKKEKKQKETSGEIALGNQDLTITRTRSSDKYKEGDATIEEIENA